MPEPLHGESLEASLTVKSLDQSTAWYTNVLSFQITTRQSVDAVAAELKRHGAALDTEPTTVPWGARIIRFRDPDGFRYTLSSTVGAN